MDKITKSLNGIKRDNEAIISFVTTADYNSFELLCDTDLVESIEKADLSNILEYTLHRMIEEEFTEEEIFSSSEMHTSSEEELEEEEVFMDIDLGYTIKGLIVSIKED